jgi:hypothetical protein
MSKNLYEKFDKEYPNIFDNTLFDNTLFDNTSLNNTKKKITKKNLDNLYTTIMRRKIRNDIDISKNSLCHICVKNFDEGICSLLPCDHGFHRKCINVWLKETQCCPICEYKLNDDIPTVEYIKKNIQIII